MLIYPNVKNTCTRVTRLLLPPLFTIPRRHPLPLVNKNKERQAADSVHPDKL